MLIALVHTPQRIVMSWLWWEKRQTYLNITITNLINTWKTKTSLQIRFLYKFFLLHNLLNLHKVRRSLKFLKSISPEHRFSEFGLHARCLIYKGPLTSSKTNQLTKPPTNIGQNRIPLKTLSKKSVKKQCFESLTSQHQKLYM